MSEATLPGADAAAAARFRLPSTPALGSSGLSVTDLIVIVGGVLLLIAGWGLQRAHDARLTAVEVAGMPAAYPEGWLTLPVMPPALAQWTDNQGTGATLTLFAAAAPDASAAAWLGSVNPAIGQPAYTPLGGETLTINGTAATRTDYAYARQQIAQSTPPEIVRGREVSWVAGDRQLALALEAPERDWSRVEPLFAALAAATVGAKGGG